MNTVVSIIIPFYNAEKFLLRCINSVVSQTYTNIQLLLINNMSTDASLTIANSFVSDSRITLLSCHDKGVSFARNMGLDNAAGDWILFVDADDYLENDAIEKLISASNQFSDISCVEMGFVEEDFPIVRQDIYNNNNSNKSFSHNEILEDLFQHSIGHYQGYLWNKLLLRKQIELHNLRFDTRIHYNEDRLFLFEYFYYSPDDSVVQYIPFPGYHYVQHNHSAMSNINFKPISKVITEITAFDEMLNLNKDPDLQYKIENESINSCFVILSSHIGDNESAEIKYIKSFLKGHKGDNIKIKIKRFICLHKSLLCIYMKVRKH